QRINERSTRCNRKGKDYKLRRPRWKAERSFQLLRTGQPVSPPPAALEMRSGDFAQIDRAIPGDLRGRTRSLSGLSVKTSGPIGPSGMEALENGCVDHRL